MLGSYKEIVYGVVFGVGAAVLDTALDARSAHQSFLGEIGGHPVMMLYRLLFVLLGFFIGWLLWRNSTRERQFRGMMEQMRRFHQEYEARALMVHTNLQLLLTKNPQGSTEDDALLRNTYEQSRELQAVVKQRPSI